MYRSKKKEGAREVALMRRAIEAIININMILIVLLIS